MTEASPRTPENVQTTGGLVDAQWPSNTDAPRTPRLARRLSRSPVAASEKERIPDFQLQKGLASPVSARPWNLDDFELLARLGSGQYGEVFFAREATSGLPLALKSVDEEYLHEHHLWHVMRREIEIQMSLKHTNIVPLYGYFHDGGRIWLMQELAPHGNLLSYMEKFGTFSEIQAAKFTRDIARAVRYCHAKRVMHRDLKPENVVLDRFGHARLCDFGGSAHLLRDWRRETRVGTLDFLSPEETAGFAYSYEADVWSLGIMVFEMLFGKPPFEVRGKNGEEETKKKILEAIVVFPAKPKVSDEAKDLISRMLRYEPEDRLKLHEVLNHVWIIRETASLNH